jgi:flagellar export protein FliJ
MEPNASALESIMKTRDTLLRLKRFQLDERRRRVAQIETMIAEFQRMSADLDREIAAEEAKAGISDPAHFAYPTYARAATQRRDNLRRSAHDLHDQLDDAKAQLGEAFEELKKVEVLEDRERSAERAFETARDQVAMSQIGLSRAAG